MTETLQSILKDAIDGKFDGSAEQSNSASNELLGGREAGNNNSGDGKINSRSLGSKKCPYCQDGYHNYFDHQRGELRTTKCATCKGTGKRSD